MDSYRMGHLFGKFGHGSNEVGMVGLHNEAVVYGLRGFTQREYKVCASVRQDVDMHAVSRLSFKLPIFVNIGGEQGAGMIFFVHRL